MKTSMKTLSAAATLAAAMAAPGLLPAEPAEYAAAMCAALEKKHVSGEPLSGARSRAAWTNAFDSLDAGRMLFLADDLDFFADKAEKIGELMGEGDFGFVSDIRTIYRKRLFEYVRYATNRLARADWKFDGCAATFTPDRSKAPWPADERARRTLWEENLANEVLEESLDSKTGGVKAAAAAIASQLLDEYAAETNTPESVVYEAFLQSIVATYDAHTHFMPKAEYKAFLSSMELSFCGIGAQWSFKDGEAKIGRVMPGGPLARDGHVKAGDRIIAISKDAKCEPVKIAGKSRAEISALFSGERGTPLVIEVRHASGETKRYRLVRDIVPMDDERAFSRVEEVEHGGRKMKIGYLTLSSFYAAEPGRGLSKNCSDDVAAELAKLRDAKVDGVLFDLRGNPGGSLDDCVKIIGGFVHGGPAVRMKGRGVDVSLPVPDAPALCNKPLVVLTDKSSASAGELFPATMQDLGRAVVVGDTRTFGKGTAQTVVELADGAEGGVAITESRFYRVTGASTQFKGVASDIIVPSLCDAYAYEGEQGMKFALPWNSIDGMKFEQAWDLRKFVPELSRRSARRLSKLPGWKEHLETIAAAERAARPGALPLDRAKRQALRDEEEKYIDRLEKLFELREGKERLARKPGRDLVLDETMAILCDLVELNGGRVLPGRKAQEIEEPAFLDGLDD